MARRFAAARNIEFGSVSDVGASLFPHLHRQSNFSRSISSAECGASHIYLYRNPYIAPRQPPCSFSVSERFAGFERMSDALLRFLFAAERDEGFALEIQNVLLAD